MRRVVCFVCHLFSRVKITVRVTAWLQGNRVVYCTIPAQSSPRIKGFRPWNIRPLCVFHHSGKAVFLFNIKAVRKTQLRFCIRSICINVLIWNVERNVRECRLKNCMDISVLYFSIVRYGNWYEGFLRVIGHGSTQVHGVWRGLPGRDGAHCWSSSLLENCTGEQNVAEHGFATRSNCGQGLEKDCTQLVTSGVCLGHKCRRDIVLK